MKERKLRLNAEPLDFVYSSHSQSLPKYKHRSITFCLYINITGSTDQTATVAGAIVGCLRCDVKPRHPKIGVHLRPREQCVNGRRFLRIDLQVLMHCFSTKQKGSFTKNSFHTRLAINKTNRRHLIIRAINRSANQGTC